MEQLSAIMDSLDMLDAVLAVFGALIVSLWFGAGKSPFAIVSGAVMGGLMKPILFGLVLGGAVMVAAPAPELKQTPEQQQKTLDFWTK